MNSDVQSQLRVLPVPAPDVKARSALEIDPNHRFQCAGSAGGVLNCETFIFAGRSGRTTILVPNLSDPAHAKKAPIGDRRTPKRCAPKGSALLLVMWAVLLLAGAVFGWVAYIQQDVFRLMDGNLGLEARALAYSGVTVALHPGVSQETPILNRDFGSDRSYHVQLTGEGGKLNVNWLLRGEDPTKLDILERFMELGGVKFQDRQILVDCLLDWVDPDSEKHLSGKEESDDYQPANKPFQSVDEMEQVAGMDLMKGNWKDYFTVYGGGPVDLKSVSYEILRVMPGVGDARARRFVDYRDGKDKKNGTQDDNIFKQGIAEAMSFLGITGKEAQLLQPLLSYNDPTYRVISTGQAGKVNRQLTVVARKDSASPTILLWNEL